VTARKAAEWRTSGVLLERSTTCSGVQCKLHASVVGRVYKWPLKIVEHSALHPPKNEKMHISHSVSVRM